MAARSGSRGQGDGSDGRGVGVECGRGDFEAQIEAIVVRDVHGMDRDMRGKLNGDGTIPMAAADLDGRVAIDFGLYGVPESYLIDREGRIRYAWKKPFTPEEIKGTLLPMIAELSK